MTEDPDSPVTLFLQIREPDEGNQTYHATVNTDGLPETEVGCVASSLMGVAHWLSQQLGLRVAERLAPSAKWKPGDRVGPGLYIVEPIKQPNTP